MPGVYKNPCITINDEVGFVIATALGDKLCAGRELEKLARVNQCGRQSFIMLDEPLSLDCFYEPSSAFNSIESFCHRHRHGLSAPLLFLEI
jgi:hypothetical protein